jgi:hypothetical protein
MDTDLIFRVLFGIAWFTMVTAWNKIMGWDGPITSLSDFADWQKHLQEMKMIQIYDHLASKFVKYPEIATKFEEMKHNLLRNS